MSTGTPPTSGCMGGRSPGCGAGRGARPPRRAQVYTGPIAKRFEGATEDLKGHILDIIGAQSADLFLKSKRELANYVGRTFTQSGDIRRAVEGLTLPTIPIPTAPVIPDGGIIPPVENAIFIKQVKAYVNDKRSYKTT